MRPTFLHPDWPESTGWRVPLHLVGIDNNWRTYFDIIARAQHGDFSMAPVLVDLLFNQSDLDGLADLIGAIASHAQLRRVFRLIGTTDSFTASQVANASHWLEFCEACLNNNFDSELRPLFFSEFLESWEIADRDCLEYLGGVYLDNVRTRIATVRARYAGTNHFAYGVPLHPETYRCKLHSFLEADDDGLWEASATICKALFRIETLTGVRLPIVVTTNDAFRRAPSIEPVPDSPLHRVTFDPDGEIRIERQAFLRSVAALDDIDFERFQPGARYFYGHRVPD